MVQIDYIIPSTLAPANYPDLAVGGSMGVVGNTTVGGTMNITGNATIDGKLNLTNTNTDAAGAGYITSGEGRTGVQGRLHISNGEDLYLLPKGTTRVSKAWGGTGNLNVDGNTELSGVATPLLIKKGTASPDNTKIQFGDGSGWRLRFQKDDANPIMDIVDNKNVNVHGNTTVSGNLSTAGNLTVGGALDANGIGTFNNFKIGPVRIQCGYTGGSSQWVTFSTPFSNTPVVNAYFASTDDSNVNTHQWAPWAINISKTGFQVRNAGSTATSWFAIGPA